MSLNEASRSFSEKTSKVSTNKISGFESIPERRYEDDTSRSITILSNLMTETDGTSSVPKTSP